MIDIFHLKTKRNISLRVMKLIITTIYKTKMLLVAYFRYVQLAIKGEPLLTLSTLYYKLCYTPPLTSTNCYSANTCVL